MLNYTLITGCTSGIGKSLAYEFASHKHNLILVSRNEQKYLSEVTSSIKNDKLKEILTKLGESIIKSKKEGK